MTSQYLRDLHEHFEPPSWEYDETINASEKNRKTLHIVQKALEHRPRQTIHSHSAAIKQPLEHLYFPW